MDHAAHSTKRAPLAGAAARALSLTHTLASYISRLAGGGATTYGTHMNIACRGTADDTHECTHTHGRTDKSDTHSSAPLCAQ